MLFSCVQNYWFLSVGENHSHSNAGCMAGERSNVPGPIALIFGEVFREVDLPQPFIEGSHILQGIRPHLLNPSTLAHLRIAGSTSCVTQRVNALASALRLWKMRR